MEDDIYLSEKDTRVYLEGLERFKNKGVNIYVDGVYSSSKIEWSKVLKVCDSTTYYIADLIDDYEGNLKEIIFNKIKVKRNSKEYL